MQNKLFSEYAMETPNGNIPYYIKYVYSDDYYAETHPELVKDTFYDYTEEFKDEWFKKNAAFYRKL